MIIYFYEFIYHREIIYLLSFSQSMVNSIENHKVQIYNFITMQLTSAELIATSCIHSLISDIIDQIQLRQLASKYLMPYSSKKVTKVFNQVNDQLFSKQPQKQQFSTKGLSEPKSIKVDSFMSTYLEVQNENEYKKSIQKQNKGKKSQQRSKQVVQGKQKIKTSPFIELDFDRHLHEIEDGFIVSLRKNIQDKLKSIENSNKKKSLPDQKISKGKQQKISYDYNGEVIKVRQDNRNNLVNQVLRSQASKNIQKQREANRITQPTQLETRLKKQPPKKIRKDNQVQFSNIDTLLKDVTIKKGVKVTHNKTIIQEKSRKLTINQIKKTMNTVRISKSDYNRLRQVNSGVTEGNQRYNGEKEKEKQETINQEPTLKHRAYSESSLPQSHNKGTIHVSNQKLIDTYLTKISLLPPLEFIEPIKTETAIQDQVKDLSLIKPDEVDRYNLDYMRGASISLKSQATMFKLPRISTESVSKQVLKSRSKIKDENILRMQLRKKFQDKLRL